MKKILIFGLLALSLSLSGQIAKVNVGTTGGDGTGDNLRAAFTKLNVGIDTINAHSIKIPLKAPKYNAVMTGLTTLEQIKLGASGVILTAITSDGANVHFWSGATELAAVPGTGSAAWGSISGSLANQIDLTNALNAKAPVSTTMTTSHPANAITGTNITNWNTAYGWGDWSGQGFITSSALSPYALTSALSSYVPTTRTVNGHFLSTNVSVTAADVSAVAIADSATMLTKYARKASPTFTGVPAAPTAVAGTSTTQIATTAFVKALGDLKADASHNQAQSTITNLSDTLRTYYTKTQADSRIATKANTSHTQAVSTISDATTVGQNFVKLTNPSAITFPRVNADNTLSALSASDFRTAIGASATTGTVTSVATGLGLSGGTITSTGTLLVDTASASILSRQRAVKEYKAKNAVETVSKGGTGVATTMAYGLLAGGTTATSALQNIGAGTSGQIPVSAGAAALPVWTSPVDATTLNLSSYSYIIDTIAGTVYATAKAGSGLTSYTGTVAATVINQAIAALTSGGDIYFKRKNYTITTSIVDGGNSNINLIFEKGAKLTAGDGLDNPVIYLTGESNWKITNLEIDGNRTKQTTPDGNGDPETDGIKVTTCTNIKIEYSYIHDCRRFGAYFSVDNSYSGVENCFITLCGWNGITLGGYSTNYGMYAINNEVSHCSDVGITTYGVQGRVLNNYIHDIDGSTGSINSKWAIGIEGTSVNPVASYNIVSGNNITNTEIGVAVVAYRTHNTISNNTVTNTTLGSFQGMFSIASDNNIIIGNTMQSTDADVAGIFLFAGVDETVIQNNRFITRLGIWLGGTNDRTVVSNNWFNCSYWGIIIDASTCDNTRIENNDFDASVGGVNDSGTGTIYSNNILTDGTIQPTGTVSITELGYLDGVTSAIQTQINSKVAKLVTDTLRVTDATYTLALTDAGKTIRAYRTTWQRITVPLNSSVAFPVGTVITVKQDGAGIVKFLPASGVVFKAPLDSITMNTRYSWVQLIKQATDKWEFVGRLED